VPKGALGAAARATQTQGAPVHCLLYVDRSLAEPQQFGAACGVMVHEVGHLYGHGHSDDPLSAMYPSDSPLQGICVRAGTVGLWQALAISDLSSQRRYCHRHPSQECWREARQRCERLKRLSTRLWATVN
jgi:hypothetical protein